MSEQQRNIKAVGRVEGGRVVVPAAHTPGPWRVWASRNIQTQDGEQLAIVQGSQTIGAGDAVWAKQDNEDRRDAANARLIAAAPTMLEAAIDLVQQVEAYDSLYGKDSCAIDPDALRAAIAAATQGVNG